MIITELTDYYADLLAYQFRGLPNASRTVKLLTKQAAADLFVQDLLTCYDIDQAVGAQLDVLGKYVGAPRNIGTVIDRPYFGFWDYSFTLDPTKYQGTWIPSTDDPTIPAAAGGNTGWWYVASEAGTSATPIVETFASGDIIFSDGVVWAKSTDENGNGLTDYSSSAINRNGVFYDYSFAVNQNSDLTDAEYRTVIKLKIILNANDGTLSTIMDYLQTFFPGEISLIDGTNMHLPYTVLSTVPLSQALLELYLPRPMGVGITVTIISPAPSGGDPITTEGGIEITTEDGSSLTT
jgi:hypothetical protein